MRRFHSFRLDTANQCVWHGEARVYLTPKGFDVLRYLVEHAGQLVTPAKILEALWPETYINPEGLRSYIQEIRKVLQDRPDKPVFIETVRKRGYRFVAPVIDENPGGTLSGAETKRVVGRGVQMAELTVCLSKIQRGEREIVFITGEPGIGKTALADKFQRRVRVDVPGVRIARGQCVEGYGGKEPYYPLLEALGELCQGAEGESVVEILATQAPTWLVQFPALVRRAQREMLQQEILGATGERMLREINTALESITSERPLLLVLEDLQWVDPSTVDLISALARRRHAAKLLLIGTFRSADVMVSNHPLNTLKQELLVHQLCREIALGPLGEAEVAEYLAAESSGASLPDGLAHLLYRLSEGNPLFMVAMLEHMQDRGEIAVENGSWQSKMPLEKIHLEAPDNLRHMIELRIEQLSEQKRRVLEVASVTGALFTSSVVAKAANMDTESFEELCEGLARRHQVVRWVDFRELPDGTKSPRYGFVHALYREVLYGRQPRGRRSKIHLQIGERLEALRASAGRSCPPVGVSLRTGRRFAECPQVPATGGPYGLPAI